MGDVLLVRTVYNRCRKGIDAGLEGALRSSWVDSVGCIMELCAHEISRIIVEWGISPYADGMKDVILNTSELVLRCAPCGTCQPQDGCFAMDLAPRDTIV